MTKILICDDHLLVAEAMALVLEQAGHDVAVVQHPDDAYDVLEHTPIDTCVMDLRYGEDLQLAGIARIADRHPHLRIVVVSGHLDDDLVERVRDAGAAAWGLKRGDLSAIVALVVGDTDTPVAADVQDRWAEDPLAQFLTSREREVLEGLARGETTAQLARRFGVSDATVRTHTQCILNKLGVHSRLEAVMYAVRNSLIVLDTMTSSVRAEQPAALVTSSRRLTVRAPSNGATAPVVRRPTSP